MIIDCFLFFNELELLEVRLNELSPYVDKFMLVESHHTFQGDPKPLYYAANRERFAKFNDRIIHVVADLAQGDTYENGWERERASRDAIVRGLEGLPGESIILLSDLDEIPNLIGWDSDREVPACWSHTLYYYYVDLELGRIKGTVAIPLRMFLENKEILGSGSKLREWGHYNPRHVIEGNRGGWHFSYLGGVEAIQAKIKAFSHAELKSHATRENILKALQEGWKDNVDLFGRRLYNFEHVKDGDLPKYLLDNRDKFSHFWMPGKLPYGLREIPEAPSRALGLGLELGLGLSFDQMILDEEALEHADEVVDSGPIVMSMVKEKLSELVREGAFEECASSGEQGAPVLGGPGESSSEEMEASPSSEPIGIPFKRGTMDEVLLRSYMAPAVRAIAEVMEKNLLDHVLNKGKVVADDGEETEVSISSFENEGGNASAPE